MDKELELLNSKNEPIEEIDELDDLDAVKEKYRKLSENHKDIFGKNRQLFERTKKAEGDLKDLKAKADEPKLKSEKSDEALLKRLDTMALRIANIEAADEVELFNKWKEETGREADSVIGNKIFQAELTELRTAKANAAATANIKGESGKGGGRDTPEYWIAKATKNSEGEMMFPEDMPKDYKLRAAIVEKMGASAKASKEFYNQ